jgi:hypothetical protein
MSRSDQLRQRCTNEPNYSSMSVCLAGALITCERALETCEPSCVPEAARPFFIPVVHNPLKVVGYVAASELSSQGGKAWSHGTCGSTRAHLFRKARSGAEGHVAASELTSTRRQGPGPRDTWWRRSPPLQGGVVRSNSLRGSAWMHVLLLILT